MSAIQSMILSDLLKAAFVVEWEKADGAKSIDVHFVTEREAGRFEGMLVELLPGFKPKPIAQTRPARGFGAGKPVRPTVELEAPPPP